MSETPTHNDPESMAGLKTHDRVVELVRENCPNPLRFADLGAGQGAFTKRLKNLGHDVVAVDFNSSYWKVPEIDIVEANLDDKFGDALVADKQGGKFDAAVAIEIIEHLENPFQFAREIAKILTKDGLLFLTTPNVEAVNSRLIFLYTGRLKSFGAYETVRPAHITPIFRWKLEMLLDEAGFEIIHETFNQDSWATGTNLKGRFAAFIVRAIAPFVKGNKGGESRIIIARYKGAKS